MHDLGVGGRHLAMSLYYKLKASVIHHMEGIIFMESLKRPSKLIIMHGFKFNFVTATSPGTYGTAQAMM